MPFYRSMIRNKNLLFLRQKSFATAHFVLVFRLKWITVEKHRKIYLCGSLICVSRFKELKFVLVKGRFMNQRLEVMKNKVDMVILKSRGKNIEEQKMLQIMRSWSARTCSNKVSHAQSLTKKVWKVFNFK